MLSAPRKPLHVISNAEHATALMLNPLRLDMLKILRAPHSATTIASRLGQTRQSVNYHLRELESHGFAEHVEDRRKGNCIERVMIASAESYLISPEAIAAVVADPSRFTDHASALYLIASAAQLIRDLDDVITAASAQNKSISTLTLNGEIRFDSPESRRQFTGELLRNVARIVKKYHKPGAESGRTFKWLFGAHPRPNDKPQPVNDK